MLTSKRLLAALFVTTLCAGQGLAATIIVGGPPVYTNAGGPSYSDPFVPGTWMRTDVRAGSSVGVSTDFPQSGTSSVYFSGTNGVSKANLTYVGAGPLGALSNLTSLSYDWYRDSSSTNPANQAPVLRLLTNGGATLIWEQANNGFVGALPVDQWITSMIDPATARFWTTNSVNQPGFGAGATIAQLIAGGFLLPGSDVVGIEIGFGSGWNGAFVGAADNVTIGFGNGDPTTWNFDVAAEVPEPASLAVWSLMGVAGLAYRWRNRKKDS